MKGSGSGWTGRPGTTPTGVIVSQAIWQTLLTVFKIGEGDGETRPAHNIQVTLCASPTPTT